jgi:hypothetical protein
MVMLEIRRSQAARRPVRAMAAPNRKYGNAGKKYNRVLSFLYFGNKFKMFIINIMFLKV